jgi:uncharacterized protein (TIGR02598 family)
MKQNLAPLVSPRTPRAGFTLTEIVIALGVISFAFVALLGLLPAGMDSSRKAADSTVIATVLEDLHNRLRGLPLVAGTPQPLVAGGPSISPAFFDDQGVFISPNASPADLARRLYRADIKIGTWSTQPTGTSGLRPITITLTWPVSLADPNLNALGANKSVVTYSATTLTGSNWVAIDPKFVPKIEY